MQVCVIGLGYLGATHAVAMSVLGHKVIGIEPNQEKLAQLQSGKLPFFEPGLQDALKNQVASGSLTFQSAHDADSSQSDAFFICVGTPQQEDSNHANLTYVFDAARSLAEVIPSNAVVAGKSTVPVGTARRLGDEMSAISGFEVQLVWNPEFLREGTALEDSLNPDRIVVGGPLDGRKKLLEVYERQVSSGVPVVETNLETAELVKTAANSFLATKISFINAMADVAQVAGADVSQLSEALGLDDRIGKKFLRSGLGFGGGCLPKDIRGFVARAEELGVGPSLNFLRNVDDINLGRRRMVVELAMEEVSAQSKILLLGLSFKPDSDDLRDSPALEIALALEAEGFKVLVHDPSALDIVSGRHPQLQAANDLVQAFSTADLVILGTEWRDYLELDPLELGEPKTIIDARLALDPLKWKAAGWHFIAPGRPNLND